MKKLALVSICLLMAVAGSAMYQQAPVKKEGTKKEVPAPVKKEKAKVKKDTVKTATPATPAKPVKKVEKPAKPVKK
jgi:hypothetical protein